MLGGAWWEQVEESPRDLNAWITFTMGLGFRGVVLLVLASAPLSQFTISPKPPIASDWTYRYVRISSSCARPEVRESETGGENGR